MRLQVTISGAVLLVLASLSVVLPAARLPADAPSGFTADKGKFRILQQGNEVGTEEFELAPSGNAWIARDDATLRVSGSGETRSTGLLRVAADGTPIHYEWTSQTDKRASGSVDFTNGTAKTTINLGKDSVKEDFKFTSPRVAVLDNNLYDQYVILGRLYDWQAKGPQTFPVLIPQDRTPGTITIELLGPKTVEGAQLDALVVRSADLEINAYFDAKRRLMRLDVPAAMVEIVRQ